MTRSSPSTPSAPHPSTEKLRTSPHFPTLAEVNARRRKSRAVFLDRTSIGLVAGSSIAAHFVGPTLISGVALAAGLAGILIFGDGLANIGRPE